MDSSAGLPPVEIVSAKAMGTDAQKSQILEDDLGRVFVASRSLLVFDGQSWIAHPKPGENSLTFLVPGGDGVLWTGTNGNLGFFSEERFGEFKYHSLLSKVPPAALPLGPVWGCAPLGPVTYFLGSDKLLRWDGTSFQSSPFPTQFRLAPLRVGHEFWMQHFETGLYRLTEAGPELKFPADQLPPVVILALFRDDSGLVTVSNHGLLRPGQPAHSPDELNRYLTEHRVSSFCELPDGNLVMGTLSGGLLLTTRDGRIIRQWADSSSGLPGRTIIGLTADESGEVLGTTPTDFFHFPAKGENTVFNHLNGLRGEAVNLFVHWNSALLAATDDGVYRQVAAENQAAHFESLPLLAARYNSMVPHGDGLLLARFGGVDWFDGQATHAVLSLATNSAIGIVRMRANPSAFLVTEYRGGITRIEQMGDGSFAVERLLTLPDTPTSLFEAPDHRWWIGTVARGVFVYDPATKELASLDDPATGRPFEGPVRVVGGGSRLLFFLKGRVLQADLQGKRLAPLGGIPSFNASVVESLSSDDELFIAYERPVVTGPLHGAGVLSFANGAAAWRELDLPHLDAIGSIRAATLSQENSRRILWLGGIEGILRLDYEKIATLVAPPPPLIRLAGDRAVPSENPLPEYPFSEHQLRFRILTGDYLRSKGWLFQSRLGSGGSAWSEPGTSRSFEYSNLSEGVYRFEVRAINAAGMPSLPSAFTFRILPPWYRSAGAYAGYAVALLAAVIAFIRIRERRIRARNEELEGLVNVRTAELVKANAAKDEFLAGISHEIRNPMNGVIGIAENFRTDGLDQESRRKFSLLRQCATHLSSLLEDILDFSKVQAGAIELDPKPFDLPELVESVAGITRADSEKYGIPVEVAVSPAVPRKLVGDARRIRQILINFVSNALKFSGRGGVSVTVWCKPAAAGETEVVFAISDEGPGISAEEQARLFTRFERGAAAQKGRVPGTGLGLALCKGLAEKMGGRIWLESELGRGSCFYFSAPFRVVEVPAESPAAAGPAVTAGTRTALVVDDQEYNRIVLGEHLHALGFSVQSTQEGQAALDLAARQAFDVIFLDFNLPGLSGVDVARGIRSSNGPSAHALMLATTAFTTPEKRAQCLDAGMDAFLGKPVTRERLAKALASLPPAAGVPAAAPAPAPVPPKASDGPADRLVNLRLLARKKGVPVEAELALYFDEMDAEVARLDAAIQTEDVAEAGRVSHMLCGRCSFIFERELEQAQRRVEAAVEAAEWAEARKHRADFATLLAAARVRLGASDSGAVPPA